eukprot:7269880-Prymnesium_polylepis.1
MTVHKIKSPQDTRVALLGKAGPHAWERLRVSPKTTSPRMRFAGHPYRCQQCHGQRQIGRNRQSVQIKACIGLHEHQYRSKENAHQEGHGQTNHTQRIADQRHVTRHQQPVRQRGGLPIVHLGPIFVVKDSCRH